MNITCKKYFVIAASIWLACLALLLGFYYFMISPQQNSIADIKGKIAEKEKIVQRLKLAGTPEARAKLQSELEDQHNYLSDFVIHLDDSGKLTFNVSKIAQSISDIKAGSFASKRMIDGPGEELENCTHIMEQRINLNFNANFLGFARFLNMLERNRPIIFVDKFAIRHDKADDTEMVDMDLAVFVKKSSDKEDADKTK